MLRLDFNSMVITGPSTSTTTTVEVLGGEVSAAGVAGNEATQCLTDSFSATNQNTMPVICGTNTGYHAYFEASDDCNSLDFVLGASAVGNTIATRAWSVKVLQLACTDSNLPPVGCVNWHYGSVSGVVQSFNFGNAQLANQKQSMCVRREYGYCRICWYNGATDFSVSGTAAADLSTARSKCCSYGADGMTNIGWDCVMIPGASYLSSGSYVKINKQVLQCGRGAFIGDAAIDVTVCSTTLPFRITHFSDNWEVKDVPTTALSVNTGVRAYYTMYSC